MHAAALAAGTFSVVTSMSATVPRGWELAKAYTPAACLGVYATDIPVLLSPGQDTIPRVPVCHSAASPRRSRLAADPTSDPATR